jgi:hypothetical protein
MEQGNSHQTDYSPHTDHRQHDAARTTSRTQRTSGPRTSRDATGINADNRAPIDPRMPNLPPA